MAQYGAGRLDIRDYLGFHLRLLAGRPVSDWLPVRQAFIAQCIQPRIPAAARQAAARHRQLGHRAAIITATHEFLSTAIGALFELPVIAPRGKVVAGRFSGEFEEPVCFREHKLTCLENWQRENGLSAGHVAARHFYSDSANDLPLLEAVDHPVVVNADPRAGANCPGPGMASCHLALRLVGQDSGQAAWLQSPPRRTPKTEPSRNGPVQAGARPLPRLGRGPQHVPDHLVFVVADG